MEETPEKRKTSRRKRKTQDSQEVVAEKATIEVKKKIVKVPPKVSFSAWFHKKVAERKVRFYEDESILVFFKKQGLTEMEMEDTYESVFKEY